LIYITGDTHGEFSRVDEVCDEFKTTREDILIILGDVGLNYYADFHDENKKKHLCELPITLFWIHGNHEQRPSNFEAYKEVIWNEGVVYIEKAFPNILFAKDGEIFDLNGLKTIVIGGAYSVDKFYRIYNNYGWWEDEQPSEEIKQYVEMKLEQVNWNIDVVLSHTVSLKYEPVEVFIGGIDQSKVDKSTEIWLDSIEKRLNYKKWYVGHYHTIKKINKLEIMFENFEKF